MANTSKGLFSIGKVFLLLCYGDKNPGVEGGKQYLKDGVKGDKTCTVFSVSSGEIVPDNNHCNAAGQPDQNQANHIFVIAGEKAFITYCISRC